MANSKSQLGLDTEYDALRRRMSRVRVKEGQRPAADDFDIPTEDDDQDFKDLIKFWKKHNVGFAKEMMNMVQANKAKKTAKDRGRRKSIEFEDLEQSPSGLLSLPSHLKSERKPRKQVTDRISEEGEEDEIPSIRRPRKTLSQKQRSFTSSRTNSKSNMIGKGDSTSSPRMEGQAKKHVFRRADSESMVSKLSSSPKPTRERLTSDLTSSKIGTSKPVKKK